MSPGYLIKSILNRTVPGRFMLHRHGRLPDQSLALTFDDGPHPDNTPRILDILDRLDIKATFFIQGCEAKDRHDMVRRVVIEGHQIGNHGFHHLDCRKVSTDEFVNDIEDAQKLFEDITGNELGRIFRPPYGSVTPGSFWRLNRLGYRYVFWSTDSRDSFIRSPESLLAHMQSLDVESGDVLLFHEDYDHTVEILEAALSFYQQQGYRFATVDGFFNPDIRPGS